MLDAFAKNESKLDSYRRGLSKYHGAKKKLDNLIQQQREANQQYDYNLHLYNELIEADLKENEQIALEEQIEKLNNVEEIQLNLSEAVHLSTTDEIGLQSLMNKLENRLKRVAPFSKEYQELSERVTSVKIELDDIVSELENANENIDSNPSELEKLNDRLQLIYNLQKKHYVASNTELLEIQNSLSEKVAHVENAEEIMNQKQQEIDAVSEKLNQVANLISKARIKVIPNLKKELEFLLAELGMQNARFSIEVSQASDFLPNGKDELSFLFSANKGGSFGELKKVASGGELSRIMLAIKKILSDNTKLPTIIFDEIDTGVSGEISNKIAHIMQQMAKNMQVITITHLPQIAAKGNQHYKVFKEEVDNETTSSLKMLSADERIVEIAEMLSGKNISDSAITHAKELLN